MEIEIVTQNGAKVPTYGTDGSAGFDLVANNFKTVYTALDNPVDAKHFINSDGKLFLAPNARVLIGTDLSFEIPLHHELQIRSRSGMTLKEGLVVLNAPGTIDSDYRGEVGIILLNHSNTGKYISIGDRVAQGVVTPYVQVKFSLVAQLTSTKRGAGGYGSTGTN